MISEFVIGDIKNFTFLEGFSDLNYNVMYKVVGRETLSSLNGKKDLYTLVYKPKDISRQVMLEDIQSGYELITLSTLDNKSQLEIPSKYLVESEESSTYAYIRNVLMVDLGPIPHDISLEDFKTHITKSAKSTLGIVPNIKEVPVTNRIYVSDQTNEDHLYNQQLIKSESPSLLGENNRLEQENISLKQQILELNLIIENM